MKILYDHPFYLALDSGCSCLPESLIHWIATHTDESVPSFDDVTLWLQMGKVPGTKCRRFCLLKKGNQSYDKH